MVIKGSMSEIVTKVLTPVVLLLAMGVASCDREQRQIIPLKVSSITFLPNLLNPQLFVSEFEDTNYVFQSQRDTVFLPLPFPSITREMETITATYRDSMHIFNATYRLQQKATGDQWDDYETQCVISFGEGIEMSQLVFLLVQEDLLIENGFFYPEIIWGTDTLNEILTSKAVQDSGATLLINTNGSIAGFRDASNRIYNRR